MKIQFNTNKNINGDEKHQNYFSNLIEKKLIRYQSHVSRIEVYITDQNGKKEGLDDILCLLEARIEGIQTIAVSDQADSIEQAVSGATEKLKTALETILGRMQNQKRTISWNKTKRHLKRWLQ